MKDKNVIGSFIAMRCFWHEDEGPEAASSHKCYKMSTTPSRLLCRSASEFATRNSEALDSQVCIVAMSVHRAFVKENF